jgi:hypothetical protein
MSFGQTSLSKSQNAHLKLTLRKLGPFYFKLDDVWTYANLKAKKGQFIDDPNLISNYVMDKMISESMNEDCLDNNIGPAWSIVGGEWIRYVAPKHCQYGHTVRKF